MKHSYSHFFEIMNVLNLLWAFEFELEDLTNRDAKNPSLLTILRLQADLTDVMLSHRLMYSRVYLLHQNLSRPRSIREVMSTHDWFVMHILDHEQFSAPSNKSYHQRMRNSWKTGDKNSTQPCSMYPSTAHWVWLVISITPFISWFTIATDTYACYWTVWVTGKISHLIVINR